MTGWDLLPRLVLLLAAAVVAGLLMRRIRQSVIVGYLIAGVLLGPTGFNVVGSDEDVKLLSELGIALLLFSIGLEFSLARLRELGRIALGAGSLQIAGTALVVFAVVLLLGRGRSEAAVLAMALAMSSTAVVLRLLTDRAELDSAHGRAAIGILLLQDIAVIPVLIATDALSSGGNAASFALEFATRLGIVAASIAVAWAAARLLLPRVLSAAALSGSRDVPVVIAVCLSIGAAWAAHTLGFSPSLGAFIAGFVLSESPFANQLRADATPLSAVFVTLFFASAGTAVNLPLDLRYFGLVLLGALAVMVGKEIIAGLSVWTFQRSFRTAFITGAAVAQAGEFSFMVLDTGARRGLLTHEVFQYTLGVAMMTLVLAPYALSWAPPASLRLRRWMPRAVRAELDIASPRPDWKRVLVVGYGPAGQHVVCLLQEQKVPFLVMDMNPDTVAANRQRLPIELGDATQREVLHHAGVGQSLAVVITIPDPATALLVCDAAQRLAPGVPIVARSRYHMYAQRLSEAGADCVADEEQIVGGYLAQQALSAARRNKLPVA
jgi:CPA2 family monovalent cation:H+ antiporter-2